MSSASYVAMGGPASQGQFALHSERDADLHTQQQWGTTATADSAAVDDGDDLLLDLSCSCCCRCARTEKGRPRSCCSVVNVAIALVVGVLGLVIGCVAYSATTLAHVATFCSELKAAVIAIPVVCGFLWIIGVALLMRSYRHRREAFQAAITRSSLTHGGVGCDDERVIGLLESDVTSSGSRRCTCRRLTRFTFSAAFWLIFAVLNLVIIGTFSALLFMENHTLPTHSGTLRLDGDRLSAPVTISRTTHGVLHIESQDANSAAHGDYDLFYAQGVAHAQERLWQMEFQRAVGAGRLSELVGYNEDALQIDRLARTMGFYAKAQSSIPSLSERSRAILQAYCDGVNAYLRSDSLALSLEFYVLGLSKPAAWSAADVLVWTKIVSFMLSGNLDQELLRWDLHVLLGLDWDRIEELLPPYDETRFPTVLEGEIPEEDMRGFDHTKEPREEPMVLWSRSGAGRKYLGQLEQARAALHGTSKTGKARLHSGAGSAFSTFRRVFGPATASNNWVVSGNRTSSGRPLLSNDPHLQLMAPSIWILNRLKSPSFDAVGASFVGTPGVILGHNANISWGVTNVGTDCQDLFIMDGNQTHYVWKNQTFAYTIRTETIRIKHHRSELLTVRESLYGPVISDLSFDIIHSAALNHGHALSLRWTSLDEEDTTFDAFLEINTARGWGDFQAALGKYRAPSQNMIYADVLGNIGYQTTAIVPVRANNGTGLSPVPGDGNHDWVGWVPFASMPRVLNPRKGYVASANNAVVPRGYKVYLTGDWDAGSDGYRAKRITDMIVGQGPAPSAPINPSPAPPAPHPLHDASSMRLMQLDYFSGVAADFVGAVVPLLKPRTAAGLALVESWSSPAFSAQLVVGSVAGAQFEKWYVALQTLAGRETNSTHWADSQYLLRVMTGQLPDDPNCKASVSGGDGAEATATEDAAGVGAVSPCVSWASELVDQLSSASGASDSWGSCVHKATFAHQILGGSPLACAANRPVAHGGDFSTVNVGGFDAQKSSMAQSHGPSYRQIIDWSGGDAEAHSVFMHGPGQSGNILSEQYDDLVGAWAHGEYLQMHPDQPLESVLTIVRK